MSHDIVADVLNQLMNCKKAGKQELETSRYSNFLLDVLEVAKKRGYIDYDLDRANKKLIIKITGLSICRSIKPRFDVGVDDIEKYVRRYLPARGYGIVIISTSKGLMTQEDAYKNKIGGSLIAYFY